jgi:hypothetical protein
MMARLPVRRPDPLYDASPWSGIGSMGAVNPGIGCCCLGNGGFGRPGISIFLGSAVMHRQRRLRHNASQ